MTSGLHFDLPEAAYHASPGVSASQLKLLRRSPAHLRAQIDNPEPPTEAMRLGSLYHRAILEPDRLERDYAIVPEDAPERPKKKLEEYKRKPQPQTLEAFAFWEAFDKANAGREVISADDMALAVRLADRVRRHPSVKTILREGGRSEVSVYATDPKTGLPLRGRLDWTVGQVIVDLKSTLDARQDYFSKIIDRMGYDIQAQFYRRLMALNGVEIDRFLFVAFEKKAPFELHVWDMEESDLLRADEEIDRLLALYKECQESGIWPGYPTAIRKIKVRRWTLEEGDLVYQPEEETQLEETNA